MSLFKEGGSPSGANPDQTPNISMHDVNTASNLDDTIAYKETKLKTRTLSPEQKKALENDIARLKKTNAARKVHIDRAV